MSIQWYPGHMSKARKVIEEAMASHDIVIEERKVGGLGRHDA